ALVQVVGVGGRHQRYQGISGPDPVAFGHPDPADPTPDDGKDIGLLDLDRPLRRDVPGFLGGTSHDQQREQPGDTVHYSVLPVESCVVMVVGSAAARSHCSSASRSTSGMSSHPLNVATMVVAPH